MKRTVRFLLALLRFKVQRQMTYRMSFLGGTLVDGSLFLLWLLMFEAIYSQVDSIGGWSRGQSIVYLGTFSLLNAINMTLYFFGVISIPRKIHDGELDQYLTKPVNPLLRITFESINLGSAPLIPLSIGIIVYGAALGGMRPGAGDVALYTLFVLLMALLYYDLEVLLRTLPFFFASTGGADRFEGAVFELCMRVPGVLFKGAFKVLFTFILPYGILATVPALILSSSATPATLALSAAIVAVFTAVTLLFWRFGLKNYKSASS